MVNKTVKIIAIIVAVFVILGIGGYVFVSEGKKIANTRAIEVELFEKDGMLYFTDSMERDIVFCYEPENGKIKKLSYEKLKYENSEYKFVQDSKVLKSIDKVSGEEYYIIDINNAKENGYADSYGVISFSVSDIYEYKQKLYFGYSENVRKNESDSELVKHFFSYDISSKSLEEINLMGDIGAYTVNDKYIYYVSKNEQATYINCLNLDTMEQITMVNYPVEEYPYISIDSLAYCENGIYYRSVVKTGEFALHLYNVETSELKSIDFGQGGLSFTYSESEGCFYAATFENGVYREIYKINKEFSSKELLCEKMEISFKPEYCKLSSIVAVGERVYFAAYSGWEYDDSYAVYSIDQNGKIELIKKRKKHFMRNIFRSSEI